MRSALWQLRNRAEHHGGQHLRSLSYGHRCRPLTKLPQSVSLLGHGGLMRTITVMLLVTSLLLATPSTPSHPLYITSFLAATPHPSPLHLCSSSSSPHLIMPLPSPSTRLTPHLLPSPHVSLPPLQASATVVQAWIQRLPDTRDSRGGSAGPCAGECTLAELWSLLQALG